MYACVLLSSMLLLVAIVMSYVVVMVIVTGFVCFFATMLILSMCWFGIRLTADKQCQFCLSICFCFADHRGTFFCCDIVMGGGDTSRRRSKQTAAVAGSNVCLWLEKIRPQLQVCMISVCHLHYVQVFKARHDTEIAASPVAAPGTAFYYCGAGEGEGFKRRWLRSQ